MQRDLEKLQAWRRRSKPLQAVSAKRRRERPQRAAILREKVHGQPCAIRWDGDCAGMAQDGHEIIPRGRLPGSHLISALVVGSCRMCHTKLTDNPAEAHERGWLLHSWEKEGLSK